MRPFPAKPKEFASGNHPLLTEAMTLLPIVERELRVAARKRSTFWLRVTAALVALIIAGGFLVTASVRGLPFGPSSFGKGLFAVLTWLSLAAALSAGMFFTSDCLSEEKREGTLGFLFLTDLRGYDVVFGKLLATSLRCVYALLAVFPIIAITLLMGGVSGAQFWKTILALVNGLFISLTAGMFVSTISRNSQKALAATLFLLVLLVAAGPMTDQALAGFRHASFEPILSMSSPGYLFVAGSGWGPGFWSSFLTNQLVGWALLFLACLLIPRTWQEKGRQSRSKRTWNYAWKFGSAGNRESLKRKLLDLNPILWLACRERWQRLMLWGVTILVASTFAMTFAFKPGSPIWFLWSALSGGLTLVMYLAVASQAGRFFVEAHRNGLLELLLAAPVTVVQIVQGQWRGLLRMFGAPLALFLAVNLAGEFIVQRTTFSRAAAPAPPPVTVGAPTNGTVVTNVTIMTTTSVNGRVTMGVSPGFVGSNEVVALGVSLAGTFSFVANLIALSWFGMWMGLNSRTTNLATLKTIAFVEIIPWFAIAFVSTLLVSVLFIPGLMKRMSSMSTQTMAWYPLLSTAFSTLLLAGKDLGFFLWARRKLYSEFRQRALLTVLPMQIAVPPPLPIAGAPPAIAQN